MDTPLECSYGPKYTMSSQALFSHNANILDGLEKNAFLTIRPVSGIQIQVAWYRSFIAAWYPSLLHIGMLPVTAHNLTFPLFRA